METFESQFVDVMNAELMEIFVYVDSDFGGFIVDKFRSLREKGLFLDVTLKVSGTALFDVV